MKEKHNRFRSKHFDLSEEAKFRFDILNYKTDGMIFISSILIVPFILSIVISFIQPGNLGKNNFQILYMVSICVGMIFCCIRNKIGIFKNGYLWIYIFILAPLLVNAPVSLITGFIANNLLEPKVLSAFIFVITMIITEIVITALVLKYDRKIFLRIKETFKNKWKAILIITIIGTFVMLIFVDMLIGSLLEGNFFGQSNNQGNLESILNGNYGTGVKIGYIIPLFVLTVITAPLTEEICMRNSFNLNASNRWLGFVGSSIFFGFVHYGPTFDFKHMLSYSAAGFLLSGVFLYTKGNMTYSWTIHMANNLIAFILMLTI